MVIKNQTAFISKNLNNELIEPMIFDEPPIGKSRDKPLQEAMEFFVPPTQNNISENKKLKIPMDFYNESQIDNIMSIPSIINTAEHYQQHFDKTLSESNDKVAEYANDIKAKNVKKSRISYEATESLTPYTTMQKMSGNLGVVIVGDRTIFIYNGKYYELTSIAGLDRAIVNSCRPIVKTMGRPQFVDEVSSFFLKEPKLNVKEFPVAKNIVSFNNGLLNLSTGIMQPHSKEYFTLYGINANYQSGYNVQCPMFDAFLENITQYDTILIERIWEMIGYILTPDTSAKTFFLLQGVQNSGKSVLTTVISKLFSEDAVATLDVHSYGEKFSVSELFGKSLAISPDLPAEPLDSKSVGKIKQITGNDTISAPVKYKSNLQFRSMAKIILATNHPLLLKMRDDAFFDRLVTIPFKYSVPKNEQRFSLIDDLMTERDAIVTKAMSAYFRLVANNYNFAGNYIPNQVVMNDTISEEDMSISIFKFVHSHFEQDDNSAVFTSDAHDKYIEKNRCVSLNEFSMYFAQYAEDLFMGQKSRKRKSGAINVTSCICGIKWKEGFDNDL